MDEYLDYALAMPERAPRLFMETARNPTGLLSAFECARERGIPIVALKVGRNDYPVRSRLALRSDRGQDASIDAIF